MFTTKILHKLLLGLCCFVFTFHIKTNAQIVIATPDLDFIQACANDSFNTFNTTFAFFPDTGIDTSNQFIIEMSDGEGSFSDPTIVFTSDAGTITSSPANIEFSLPTETAGENYMIRIKSTSPVATSTNSIPFAAYYKLQDTPFSINNLIDTAVFCSGGSYILSIDNPGSGTNDSPLNYPSLNFNWFKATGPTTSIFVDEGETLEVTEEGTYFVETNYGTCTSNSFSNRVTVIEVTSGEANAEIASSLGNPYCPGSGNTILSTITGLSYQWFKDGEVITDATNQMYETNESGIFSVQIDLGTCSATGTVDLISELFEASINVEAINTIETDETLNVFVTDTANNPQYEWYINDILITDATSDSYNVSEFGDYKIIISETTGCIGSREFEFVLEEAFNQFPEVDNIPNVVSPNNDTINDTWVIPTKYISGTNTEVLIMTNQGKVVLKTNDYQNNWPENNLNLTSVNQVYYYIITTADNKTKQGSITLVK